MQRRRRARSVVGEVEIFDDLEAEEERLEAILEILDDDQWVSESGAPRWSVADVVLHLALSEEAVVASASLDGEVGRFETSGAGIDEAMDSWVRAERTTPGEAFERWRLARRGALEALRRADPDRPLRWAAAPLKPRSLATTRIAEHWAHGLDITGPLRLPFPDTARLRHVAWLAHRSLPYAFSIAGQEYEEVFCELSGPAGDVWRFGSPEAASGIRGSAGAFCRVGARRLSPSVSGLSTYGPWGETALGLLRNYAA